MADEQPNKESEVTPKGAVEVDEEDLEQAAGGAPGSNRSIDSFSLNYSKIDFAGQKVVPQDLAGGGGPHIVSAGPGGGPHVVPEKKI